VCEEENCFFFAVTCDGKGDDDGSKGDARGDWLEWALNIAEKGKPPLAGPVRRDVGWPGGISEASYAPMAPSPANKDAQLASALSSHGASAAILCTYRIDCIRLICSCRESQRIHQTSGPSPRAVLLPVRARPLPVTLRMLHLPALSRSSAGPGER
jgi:hypothetical protein